jgi:hypothetical protein
MMHKQLRNIPCDSLPEENGLINGIKKIQKVPKADLYIYLAREA